MSLIITAAAPPQVRRGASASASDSSGDEFAGVLAGTPKPGDDPSDAAVTPHGLGKPHPAVKLQKVRAEDERSGADGSQSVVADRMPEALAPQRHQDITGHRAKADETSSETSSYPAVAASDGTAAAGGTAPTTASADSSSTAGNPGVGGVPALATVAAMTANASMPPGVSNPAGAAQPAAVPAGAAGPALAASADSPAVTASSAGTPVAAAAAMKLAQTAQLTQAGRSGSGALGGAASHGETAPVAPVVSGEPVTVKGGTGNGEPAPASLGSTIFTKSMLASLQALGTEVPGLGWVGGVDAPGSTAPGSAATGSAAPAKVHGDTGTVTAVGVQGSQPASTHSSTDGAANLSPANGPAGPSSSTPADASGTQAAAANAAAATASAQAAGQLAQPVTTTGLQGTAGQPHAMTSTPTQVWTAAEPLGPQLTGSVLPLRAGGDGSHQLIIALHPEQLGPVNVHVRILGDAMMIQLASGTQDAHETLRAALPELRHELQAAGLGTAQLSLDGGGTAGFSNSGSHRETFRDSPFLPPNPGAEPVARTMRATVPRTTGAIDSGLDRWL